ncbi:MAG TPA: DNA gyrase subunit A [Candidatus Limnocylindria bacterium]|jgi:DNA gyrase subunit A|nr:DNA gyrase subunit A [Candidatus Limnocylindria bacterium]
MDSERIDAVRRVSIEDEMRSAYIDYAMSVIVARALPDVRDGLKPVHRRILYTMHEMGLRSTSAYRKCAGVVGDALAKYHPHGDVALYDALVRMAQDFSLRYPLVDGQGNFGSIDGDPAAAYRYTEARLAAISDEMLADIEKETVDYVDNYDGRLREPTVLPARIPNLLINGSSGIAVGMATNIPPHNLTEICQAVIALIDNPDMTVDDLCEIVHGPDFPTGGTIFRVEDQRNSLTGEKERVDVIRHMYATGRGRVVIRGQVAFEEDARGRISVVISELPYQVNKTTLIEKMAELVGGKRITDVSDIRDESDRTGMRIVVEIKRDGSPHTVMQQLFKHTALQTSFSANVLALVDGQPQTLGLKRMLEHYIAYRREIVRRRAEFDLARARERAHILEGLKIALDNLDEVIKTIRASADTDAAREALIKRFKLSEAQANAILEMQLRRLAALERKKIEDEYEGVIRLIAELEDLLANPRKVLTVIRDELDELIRKYGNDRKTRIESDANRELTAEDLVAAEDVVVTLSQRGYIKRQQIGTFRSQRRGGKGKLAMITREEDAVRHLMVANTHDNILFFTNRGRVFITKVHTLPEASRQAKGLPIINLPGVMVDQGEYVSAIITLPQFEADHYMAMATRGGMIKKTSLAEYAKIRSNGLIAISLVEGDELRWVGLTDGQNDIILATRNGQAARFHETEVRPMGRDTRGVTGIRLRGDDEVIGMEVVAPSAELLVVTEQGYGKRTVLDDFPIKHRATGGVIANSLNAETGKVAAVRVVGREDEQLMLITEEGTILRTEVSSVNRYRRASRGVTVMKPGEGDRIVSIAVFVDDRPPVGEEDGETEG